MKKRIHVITGLILITLLLAGTAVFIGGQKTQKRHRLIAAPHKTLEQPQPLYPKPADSIADMLIPTPIPPGKSVSPSPKTGHNSQLFPEPGSKADVLAGSLRQPEPQNIPGPGPSDLNSQPGPNPDSEEAPTITPVPVAVKPVASSPPTRGSTEPSPVPESSLKIACDFESLGLGYEILRRKKTSLDLMVYTDKAGVGISYRFGNGIHLGVDNTYRYQNGEGQLRLYLSMAIRPGE